MALALALHTLAAVVWVGGMFFAYLVLRPSAAQLEPHVRLPLWQGVFSRFFPWVWAAVIALLATGFWMIFAGFGGFAVAGKYVHTMLGLGLVMMAIYAHLYFAVWPRYKRAVSAADWPLAGQNLAMIRRIVGVNLALGLVTTAVGAGGRFF